MQRAYPDYKVSGVDAPTAARPTMLAYVSKGREFKSVLADPVSGAVLGELPERSFVRILQDLHFDLLGGRTGRKVNGAGAACLLGMCLTGLVIWWPGIAGWRRALAVDLRRGWKRINVDLHSAVGIWTVAFITMWAITGVNFAFPSFVRSTVNSLSPLTVARPPSSNPAMRGTRPPPATADLIAEAQRHMPGRHLARIALPSGDTAAVQMLFATQVPTPLGPDSLETVFLDQYTGTVLLAPRPRTGAGDLVMAWMIPLHVGNFAGAGTKVLWAIAGLMPAVLFVTGLVMWWNRVVRERWARHGAPTAPRRAVESPR